MRKNIFLIPVLFCLSVMPLHADMTPYLNEFDSGSIDLKVKFVMDGFYGARGDALRAGGTVSTLDFHQSFTSYNPACLAFQKGPVVSMSLVPFEFINTPLINNFTGTNFDDTIKDAINSEEGGKTQLERQLEDMDIVLNTGAEITDVKTYIGQVHRITGFEAMAPFAKGQAAVAVAREEKFSFEVEMLLNGLEFLINAEDDADPTRNVNVRGSADLALELVTKHIVTSVGIGRKITENWGVGAVLEKYDSKAGLNGRGYADAVITSPMSTDIVEYNTGPQNSLEQTAVADLVSDSWGLRLGTSIHAPGDTAEVGLDFAIEPEMRFKGNADITYRYPDFDNIYSDFLSGDPETIEETVDEARGDYYVKLPSFMRLSAAWKPGPVLSLNYTRFFDAFYLKMVTDEQEGKVFINMTDAFRLGFNFEWFQIGGGVMIGNEGTEMYDKTNDTVEAEKEWFPLPLFSTGCVIPVGDGFRAEMEFIAVPLPLFKGALTYKF